MGRALIIKGADFSKVAMGQIPLDGKLHLTKNNYDFQTPCYPKDNGTWGRENNVDAGCIWKVNKGDVVYLKQNEEFNQLVAFINTIPSELNEPIDFANGTTARQKVYKGHSAAFLVKEDCYLYIYSKSDTLDIFPSEIYLTGYIGDRSLIQKDAIYTNTLYINSSGIWRPANNIPNAGIFFPVYAGEEVDIVANAERKSYFALVKYDDAMEKDTAASLIGQRVLIQPSESYHLSATEDCYLYVGNRDAIQINGVTTEVNIYPSSIEIKGVEL